MYKRQVRSKDEIAATRWDQQGLRLRLRLDLQGADVGLDEALALTTLRPGDSVVVSPREMIDERLPAAGQTPFPPTPKKILYNGRATLVGITVERDPAGRGTRAWADVSLTGSRGGNKQGFYFTSYPRPLNPDEVYTLDPDPNAYYTAWTAAVIDGLRVGEPNALYARLVDGTAVRATWPSAARDGQARFLAGLDALHDAGALHEFEPSKRDLIGGHGDAPTLLVQGPPGTGKSYTAAFAVLARVQGAMAADRDFRVLLTCKTHAATDVLLENVVRVLGLLDTLRDAHAAVWDRFLDPRLLHLPLFRIRPKNALPPEVVLLPMADDEPKGTPTAVETMQFERWCVVGAGPGGTYKAIKQRWGKELFGHDLIDCLVLDEASQMNLPEAAMAALPLKADGQLIVVGDHRQMPPIVAHDWAGEPRRTFRQYKAFESLFAAFRPLNPPLIQFAESFRLHGDMAEFLRREIYAQDGIAYHSRRRDVLAMVPTANAFVDAVLTPRHPLIVVVHDEAGSQGRNPFEQALITPVLTALADRGFTSESGLGVVVPHRAQRAALQEALPMLVRRDPQTGTLISSAVDTVERFQGGERTVIVVSATDSDRAYVLASSAFLLDPRRLTVALSRAKQKMILVASRSVFDLFSADEETFANAQLWKNLLRRTCTVPLWADSVNGVPVEVWGNAE